MRKTSLGYMAALAATILWSGNFVVARGVAFDIPPIQLNFWRWALALACMLPLALPRLRADWPSMLRHWRYLSLMALVGITALNALIYKAGQTTESLNMALLVPTAPVMILVLSRIIYGEPITPRRLLGLVVVLCGVLALISRGEWQNLLSVRFAAGDVWALGGAASFALYSLFIRRKPEDISVAGFNAAIFTLGLLFALPMMLWEWAALPAPVWNTSVILGVVYSAVGCSFLAYLLWTWAISVIGPVSAGMVYYTLPLFTAVEGLYILHETINLAHVLGGGLIVAGITIATAPCTFRTRRED